MDREAEAQGMRDPRRIQRIANKLITAWEAAPELRLGQLIENVSTTTEGRMAVNYLWNVEDDAIEKALDGWIAEYRPEGGWKS